MSTQTKAPTLITHVTKDGDEHKAAPDLHVLKLMRRVFGYTRPYRRKMGWLIFHVLLRSFLLSMLAWAIGAIINGPIERRDMPGILMGALGFGLLVAVTQVSFHFRVRYALEIGEAVIQDLRNELFSHLQRLTLSFYDKTKLGRIIGRMTSDIDAVRVGVQDIVFVSLVQCGQMIVSAIMMLWCDWVLFLIVLAIGPIIFFLNLQFKRRIGDAQRRAQESFSRVTATLAESVNGVRVTQGFAREVINAGFFRELVVDHSRYNLGAARTSAVFLPLLELTSQLFVAALLVLGGWRVLNPETAIPVGNIVKFFFLAGLFFDPMRSLGNQYNNALTAMVGAERVFRLLDVKPDWTDPADAIDPGPVKGQVEFDDVGFSYDGKRQVLFNISFSAEPGQTIALVGHTGSGKSSITGLVSKMYLPTSGRILIDGRDITGLNSDALHSQMGIVHQQSFLFEGTVLDNIRFGRPSVSAQEAICAVKRLGFMDMIDDLPEGFYSKVGEGGAGLSSGQKQLISFARAMVANPRILILDEATSSIDALTEARVQNALGTLLEGRTSFVVAHRLSTIRSANLILVLDHGQIVERGTHEELLALGGHYHDLHCQFVQSTQ